MIEAVQEESKKKEQDIATKYLDFKLVTINIYIYIQYISFGCCHIEIKVQASVAQGEEQVVPLLKAWRLELGSIHAEVSVFKTLWLECE